MLGWDAIGDLDNEAKAIMTNNDCVKVDAYLGIVVYC